jgi:hypothetical protein
MALQLEVHRNIWDDHGLLSGGTTASRIAGFPRFSIATVYELGTSPRPSRENEADTS